MCVEQEKVGPETSDGVLQPEVLSDSVCLIELRNDAVKTAISGNTNNALWSFQLQSQKQSDCLFTVIS